MSYTAPSIEISEISSKIANLQADLHKVIYESDWKVKSENEKEDLKKTVKKLENELVQMSEIRHLLDSVSEKAHKKITEEESFREKFSSEGEVPAYVVSVDIRRSTELMLKARSPKKFAEFITTLCNDLVTIFKTNMGVVDKFTGDGILAFFPEFFSGKDAGYYALLSAQQANDAFEKRYKEFRSSFSSVLLEVGLGTGIDFGNIHLVRMAGALTIVGQPVVYACRLGGAPAGKIYLNQPAYEMVYEKYKSIIEIKETSITIKHEGDVVCYDTQLTEAKDKPEIPSWLDE